MTMVTMDTKHIMIPLKIGNRLRNTRRFKHYTLKYMQSMTNIPIKYLKVVESGNFTYNQHTMDIAYKEAKVLGMPLSFLHYICTRYKHYNNEQLSVSIILIKKEFNVLLKSVKLRHQIIENKISQYPSKRYIKSLHKIIMCTVQYHLQQYHLINRLVTIKRTMPKSYSILLKASKLSPKMLTNVYQLLVKLSE